MKKGRVFALALLAIGVIGCQSVAAYLSDADQQVNEFSVGVNTITPDEDFETPSPGKKTVKSPKAANTGSVECYVRAKVLLSDSRADSYITYYNNGNKGMNTADWIPNADGWKYYRKTLRPGEKTVPVFTHIQLEKAIPDTMKDVAIDVVFESAQSDGFRDAQQAFAAIEGQ